MIRNEVTQLNEPNVYFTLEFYVEAREGRYYDSNSRKAHRNPKTRQMEYDNYVRSYISQIIKNAHRLPSEWQEVIKNNNNVSYIELAYIILEKVDIKERL
ncbi:hypothetical protein ACF91D_29425 [Staphylococcus sp. 231237_7MaSpsaltlick]|uniref:hypothetical protein n=1 Tax=Staphylococcus TaxID=1279 RepID=UPI00370B5CE2